MAVRKKAKPAKKKVARPARKAKPKTKSKAKTKRKSPLTQLNYALSDSLAAVVGKKAATRPEVVKKLWVYIKDKKLQDPKQRRMIRPDKLLCEVLGSKPIDMLKMATALNRHIKKA